MKLILIIKKSSMSDKIDKNSLNEDPRDKNDERPNNIEPLIKSDIPDFEYTPPPPRPNLDDSED